MLIDGYVSSQIEGNLISSPVSYKICPKCGRMIPDYSICNCQDFNDGIKEGRKQREEEIIKILENNWLRGTVARRVVDDIIKQIKEGE